MTALRPGEVQHSRDYAVDGTVEKRRIRFPPRRPATGLSWRRAFGAAAIPFFLWRAWRLGVPGLSCRLRAANLGARLVGRPGCGKAALRLLLDPIDSVRHFELDFAVRAACAALRREGNLLDASSPRLFALMLLHILPRLEATISNPDPRDLEETRRCIEGLGMAPRSRLLPLPAAALAATGERFAVVSSLSVVEHIPGPGDREAVAALWDRVRPGGRLLLTLPCAARAWEEWLDLDAYGQLPPDGEGFFHGQTFFDADLLAARVYSVTGPPAEQSILGERREGAFFADRAAKNADPAFPYWREPYSFAETYRGFARLEDLPGIGVIALRFQKPG